MQPSSTAAAERVGLAGAEGERAGQGDSQATLCHGGMGQCSDAEPWHATVPCPRAAEGQGGAVVVCVASQPSRRPSVAPKGPRGGGGGGGLKVSRHRRRARTA